MSDEKKVPTMHDVLCYLLEHHAATPPAELRAAIGEEKLATMAPYIEAQVTFRNNAAMAGAVRKHELEGFWVLSSAGTMTDPKTGKPMPHKKVGLERVFHADMVIYVDRMTTAAEESRIEAPPPGLILP